jgi:hypothetical protein
MAEMHVCEVSSMTSIIGWKACHCSCGGTRSSKTLMENDTAKSRVEYSHTLSPRVPSFSEALSLDRALNLRGLGGYSMVPHDVANARSAFRKTDREYLSFSGSDAYIRMSVAVPNLSRPLLIVISLSLTNGCIRSRLWCTRVFIFEHFLDQA